MKCLICPTEVEKEREFLGLSICCSCAKRVNPPKVKGYMEWSHKTAPVLQLTTQEGFDNFKRDTDRKGQSSILRMKMTGGGRLM